ncbi:unnamed protein product [Polarella glacialis]|uniref:Uncharacterized protein n=1 Tax=Polarella glacialis TaxID=89957 RepID=A0A813F120_POLGL|nr:unnamed protein product [Polarella glacialis]
MAKLAEALSEAAALVPSDDRTFGSECTGILTRIKRGVGEVKKAPELLDQVPASIDAWSGVSRSSLWGVISIIPALGWHRNRLPRIGISSRKQLFATVVNDAMVGIIVELSYGHLQSKPSKDNTLAMHTQSVASRVARPFLFRIASEKAAFAKQARRVAASACRLMMICWFVFRLPVQLKDRCRWCAGFFPLLRCCDRENWHKVQFVSTDAAVRPSNESKERRSMSQARSRSLDGLDSGLLVHAALESVVCIFAANRLLNLAKDHVHWSGQAAATCKTIKLHARAGARDAALVANLVARSWPYDEAVDICARIFSRKAVHCVMVSTSSDPDFYDGASYVLNNAGLQSQPAMKHSSRKEPSVPQAVGEAARSFYSAVFAMARLPFCEDGAVGSELGRSLAGRSRAAPAEGDEVKRRNVAPTGKQSFDKADNIPIFVCEARVFLHVEQDLAISEAWMYQLAVTAITDVLKAERHVDIWQLHKRSWAIQVTIVIFGPLPLTTVLPFVQGAVGRPYSADFIAARIDCETRRGFTVATPRGIEAGAEAAGVQKGQELCLSSTMMAPLDGNISGTAAATPGQLAQTLPCGPRSEQPQGPCYGDKKFGSEP